mmetsp:Transcript_30598/g.58666  ORF Transcript_30598/g.58666 Transcript_30598/m.58666 type:complete len:1184 (-) Transcript_30598:72-3623(-)
MSSRDQDSSSMSSLSAGLSGYNAAEPKPMSSANSVRSKRSYASVAPPLPHGGGSVAQSYRSNQPRSVNSHSAQSVASGISYGSAGLQSRAHDDDQSNATERMVGMVKEMTRSSGVDDYEQRRAMEEDRLRYQEEIQSQLRDDGSRSYRSGSRTSADPNEEYSRYSQGRHSVDPDEASRSVRSGMPPPPPRSALSNGSSRHSGYRADPDGMSQDFGADDPDGRHYAPGVGAPMRGPPSVSTRGSRSQPSQQRALSIMDQPSAAPSMASQSRMSRSYYKEEESIPDEGSYYSRNSRSQMSRGSRDSRSHASTMRSVPAPPPRLSEEMTNYTGAEEDDLSYAISRAEEDNRTYTSVSTKKARPIPANEPNPNKRAMWWYNFSRCVTCMVHDRMIKKDDADAKQAWREKVAICFCVFCVSGFFVGIFGFVPVLLCRERTVYTLPDVQARLNENWIVVNGNVYDVTGLFDRHPTGPQGVQAFVNDDASRMFPRVPPALLPSYCINQAKIEDNSDLQSTQPVCKDMTEEDKKMGIPCHTFVTGMNATSKYLGEFEQGILAHDGAVLLASPFTFWVSIHDRVYNVTEYINNIRNEQTKQIEKDHPEAYLEPTLNNLVINKLNEDATELFLSVYPDDRVLACMDELFYVGIIDTRFDVMCFVLNIIMYFLLGLVALVMVAQMICSLMYVAKGTRTYTAADTQDQVLILVPCYNEGGKELIKTIDSVIGTTYPEENKCIFIIADGVVTGSGEAMSTPEHLAEILGFEIDFQNDEMYGYDSIGLLTTNNARVYHGYYEVEDRSLKYVVVVKAGLPMEKAGSAKPGNRGKRDSQLIMMGFFNRIYHGRELNELDAAIEDALIDLNMQSDDMRVLMTIDADTRVDEMSLTHMVYAMNQSDKILALCGETKVDNKWQTWVTMFQVFEYYNNHHMKKAFESAFGCVTCLPGCFTMYRIINDDGKPLLADDHVFAEYLRNDIDSLHEQNLFHLGEDRMLTTLLLHFFPDHYLTYVPEAQCFTIVPHTLRILFSQRRRWINSTYHNLLELTKVKTMCGVLCCSMKTVVWLDLIACMILPASTVYACYLIFLVAAGKTQFSLLLLVLYGLLIGVQLVVFIIRSRYDFLFWFIFFTIVGVPVFYFFLPLYAFWHMDDFSWGETRKVAAMKENFSSPQAQQAAAEKDDDSESDDDEEGGVMG